MLHVRSTYYFGSKMTSSNTNFDTDTINIYIWFTFTVAVEANFIIVHIANFELHLSIKMYIYALVSALQPMQMQSFRFR